MDISELVQHVRTAHDHHPSIDDQVRVIAMIAEYGYACSEALTQTDIETSAEREGIEFDCVDARPALDNLVDLGVLSRQRPANGQTFVISERLDEIVNGRFDEVLAHDREALINHLQDQDSADQPDDSAVADGGVTPRAVVADAFDVVPSGVEAHLRAGQPVDQRGRLNAAIEAIRSNPDVETRGTYGKITLRQPGYRYRLTDGATQRITNGGEADADSEEME